MSMELRGPMAEYSGASTRSPGVALLGLRDRMRRSPWTGASLNFGGASQSSTSRVAGQRQRWVVAATDCDRKAARPEDWRRIVEEVWQARESRWVQQRIRERPVTSDQVVAFKALVLMQRVLQSGPVEAAAEWGLPNSLLDELVAGWSFSCQSRLSNGTQQMHCAQAVIEYAKLLMAKMELMVERDAGCGRFDGNIVCDRLLVEPSDLLQALAMLLNFAEKLMPLASHLVAPSKDWRRLEGSQYMHVYVGGILALLHEAWLLLCAVSLYVKNLLCQVHAQKQREDSRSRHDSAGMPPPWLQLSLHLLAAQPRFVWFHQSMCDFVAHCHQLRVAGFRELAPFIPTVPSSLLNLFADLGELVKGHETKEGHMSISNLSTSAPSDLTTREFGQTATGSWEPSPCVIDALRTVDSIQRSTGAAARVGTPSGECESEAATAESGTSMSVGSAGRPPSPGRLPPGYSRGVSAPVADRTKEADSTVRIGTHVARAPAQLQSVLNLEDKWPRSGDRSMGHRLQDTLPEHSYAQLDDDDESEPASSPPPPDAESSTGGHEEQAPLVVVDDEPAPVVFENPWCQALPFQGYNVIDWTPEAPAIAPPAPAPVSSAPGIDGGPPSWATAICRSNVGTSRTSMGETSPAIPLFSASLWKTDEVPDRSSAVGSDRSLAPGSDRSLPEKGGHTPPAKGATVEAPAGAPPGVQLQRHLPGSMRAARSLSAEGAVAASSTAADASSSVAKPMGSLTNPFDNPQMQRSTVALKPEVRVEARGRQGSTPLAVSSHAPPHAASASSPARRQPMPLNGGGGIDPRTSARDAPNGPRKTSAREPFAPSAGRATAVGAPLRVELPGVKPRTSATPLQGRGRASPLGGRPPSLRASRSPVRDGSLDRGNSGSGGGGSRGTPREAKDATCSPSAASACSPSLLVLGARQVRAAEEAPTEQPRRSQQSLAANTPTDRSPAAALTPTSALSPTLPLSQSLASGTSGADWEVDPVDLRLEEMVGSGTTAEVYRGSWFGTDVAVKKLRHSGPLSIEFTRELSVLLRLRHPNLVLFMGAATAEAQPMIISEFCAGGTVFTLMHQRPMQAISWPQRLKVAIDVAKGMNFLHRRQVVHRDLKSLNLLLAGRVTTVDEVPAVKISDFGLSRISSPDSKVQACMTSGAGTYHWMAPEVLDGHKYDEKVDVYSYGICLFEVIARRIPYDGSGLEPVSIAVAVSKGRRPDLTCVPQDCPADLRFTMECCWAHCPTGRPGFDTILETLKLVHCP